MKKEGEPEKHRCKICRKSFPSGRSLGGHMRSHMHSYASDAAEKATKLEGSAQQLGSVDPSYGLRENPKKTWRLSAFVEEDSPTSSVRRKCKECGKGFRSWKALFGHMRCHSDKIRRPSFEEEEGSWSEQKVSLTVDASASSSSITEHETELEDVARSLMMLSQDVGIYREPAFELSDKRSVALEEDELKRSVSKDWHFSESPNSAELEKKRARFDVREAKWGRGELSPEGQRQCGTCMKTFNSYQALGGHRASHKRVRGCCLPKPENTCFEEADASAVLSAVIDDSHSGLSKKNRIHECCICGKQFSSGQALGGHKRSHLLVSNQAAATTATVKAPELIDLNLPAPIDEESTMSNPSPIFE